jgi:hypothetical protein
MVTLFFSTVADLIYLRLRSYKIQGDRREADVRREILENLYHRSRKPAWLKNYDHLGTTANQKAEAEMEASHCDKDRLRGSADHLAFTALEALGLTGAASTGLNSKRKSSRERL